MQHTLTSTHTIVLKYIIDIIKHLIKSRYQSSIYYSFVFPPWNETPSLCINLSRNKWNSLHSTWRRVNESSLSTAYFRTLTLFHRFVAYLWHQKQSPDMQPILKNIFFKGLKTIPWNNTKSNKLNLYLSTLPFWLHSKSERRNK